MGHFADFKESLLCDNVMSDVDAIMREVRKMSQHESQSRIDNKQWHNRIRYHQRAYQLAQKHIIKSKRNLRTKQK